MTVESVDFIPDSTLTRVNSATDPVPDRSHRNIFWLAIATGLIIATACRGLIAGHGTYQVLIDPGIPPDSRLLDSVCANQSTLLTSANLGTRVLYPSSYGICAAIRGALHLHVQAWLISRLMAPTLLWIAAFGGAIVCFQITESLNVSKGSRRALSIVIGSIYALSPFIFDELAASHIYFLVASAVIPFTILLLRSPEHRHPIFSIAAAGLLMALAFSQLQYTILLPILLLLFGLWIGASRRYYRLALLAYVVGLIAELPWVLADLLYPPQVDLSSYFTGPELSALSVSPLNAIRLLGYPTPFFEISSGRMLPVVSAVLAMMFGTAAISWWCLSRWRRAAVGLLIGAVLIYIWGARGAPLYGIWSQAVPTVVTGLLRERYAVLSVIAVFVLLGIASACFYLELRQRWLGLVVGMIFLLFGSWAYWNGHLSIYGTHRTTYPDQGRVAGLIAADQRLDGGSVLTVPFGSIVKEQGWPAFGRSPFSIGGPVSVLDAEGSVSGGATPLVQSLAAALDSVQGCAIARPLLNHLEVRYIVDWKYLIGDSVIDRQLVLNNLAVCGFTPVLSDTYVTVLVDANHRFQHLVRSRYLAVGSENDTLDQTVASAWQSPAVELSPGIPRGSLFPSGSISHLGDRDIDFSQSSGRTQYTEPAFLSQAGRLVGGHLLYSLDGGQMNSGPFTLADGAPVLSSGTDPNVSGPVDIVYKGTSAELPLAGAAQAAVGNIQNADNVSTMTLSSAGITATAGILGTVTITASADVAGLPIPLPVIKSAYYRIEVPIVTRSGTSGSAVLVGNGNVLSSVPIQGDSSTVLLGAEIPSNVVDLYMYIYQPAGGSTTLGTVSGTAYTAIRSLAPIAQPSLDGFATSEATAVQSLPVQPVAPLALGVLQDAALKIQNTNNPHRTSLTNSGVTATATQGTLGPMLSVSDRIDTAGVPIEISGTPGQTITISMECRSSNAAMVRLRLVSGPQDIAATSWADAKAQWATLRLSAVILSGEANPYLYIEVAGQTGRAVTVQFRTISTSLYSPAPTLVSDAELMATAKGPSVLGLVKPSRQWAYLGASYDTFYRLPGSQVVLRLPPSADGIGNAWLIRSPRSSFIVTYAPETVFKSALAIIAFALSTAVLLSLFMAVRRRVRTVNATKEPS